MNHCGSWISVFLCNYIYADYKLSESRGSQPGKLKSLLMFNIHHVLFSCRVNLENVNHILFVRSVDVLFIESLDHL